MPAYTDIHSFGHNISLLRIITMLISGLPGSSVDLYKAIVSFLDPLPGGRVEGLGTRLTKLVSSAAVVLSFYY